MSPRAKLPPKRKTKRSEAERVANVEADVKVIEQQLEARTLVGVTFTATLQGTIHEPPAVPACVLDDVMSKLDATLAGFTFTPPVTIADLHDARTMLRAAIGDVPFALELRIEGEHSDNPRVLVELYPVGTFRPCCERVLPVRLDGSVVAPT